MGSSLAGCFVSVNDSRQLSQLTNATSAHMRGETSPRMLKKFVVGQETGSLVCRNHCCFPVHRTLHCVERASTTTKEPFLDLVCTESKIAVVGSTRRNCQSFPDTPFPPCRTKRAPINAKKWTKAPILPAFRRALVPKSRGPTSCRVRTWNAAVVVVVVVEGMNGV